MNRIKDLNKKASSFSFGKVAENGAVFLFGGILYVMSELLYRGFTHITMFFAGGICLLIMYVCEKKLSGTRLYKRCILYAFAVTLVELGFGVAFNMVLDMNVWDYSDEPLNFLGQICPEFVFMWLFLSLPAIFICGKLRSLFKKW